jgi:hypothetical protein
MIEIILKTTVDGLLENSKTEILVTIGYINENVYLNGVRSFD